MRICIFIQMREVKLWQSRSPESPSLMMLLEELTLSQVCYCWLQPSCFLAWPQSVLSLTGHPCCLGKTPCRQRAGQALGVGVRGLEAGWYLLWCSCGQHWPGKGRANFSSSLQSPFYGVGKDITMLTTFLYPLVFVPFAMQAPKQSGTIASYRGCCSSIMRFLAFSIFWVSGNEKIELLTDPECICLFGYLYLLQKDMIL